MHKAIFLTFWAAFAVSGKAAAQEHRLIPRPSTACLEDHTLERAGNPNKLSRFARPGISPHEGDGLVGGSLVCHGDGPQPYDGTFGWDYEGFRRHPGLVFLGWAHDRAKQPKQGPYKTDGHHIPDPVSLHPIRRLFESRDP